MAQIRHNLVGFLYFVFTVEPKKYRRMIKYFNFILHIARFGKDERHFFYICIWMIAALATNKKFLEKSLARRRTSSVMHEVRVVPIKQAGPKA
jgi:hypothetical protein